MTFDEVLAQVQELLQQQKRVSYRGLKRRFDLDDEYLEDLKEELIGALQFAVDEEGRFLVWVDGTTVTSSQLPVASPSPLAPSTQPPAAYTPPHLAERIRAEQAALEARGATDGERKTITALFADLKGSTALIEGLDPEEARTIIDPALQLMMDAVHQYDGYVAQALGDGIFALFGAPLAHEDHPHRALYAALRMQESMRRYADTLRQKGYPPLLMRVGLNTGEVVLRSIRKDDLHADYVPVGHSTNLAARMEQLATPGSIVVSAYTHRLTDGYFAFKDLGLTQIKGVEEPLNIYEVLGAGPLRTRLQVSASRYGLTRFVGRQSEMEQLNKALETAKVGQGQIVGTMGEPGLGKSRLFYEFKLLSLGGCLVLEAYSVSHGKATAYLPVIELFKSYFDIQAPDDERKRQEKVTGKVLRLDRSLEDTLPYLFALLGIEEQPSPLAQMDPQIRRRRTFEALKKLFLRESLNQPLVLIFEDLHWIDGETQGFLDVLCESVASAKILLLANYRPEYRHEWGQKTYYTQLRLAPFSKQEAEEFLDALLGIHSSPQPSPRRGEGASSLPVGERARVRGIENNFDTLKQLILDKTQGTPFFMEEIVQELVEQGVLVRDAVGAGLVPARSEGAHKGTPLQIPPTVQGVLAARIDRLAPDEKALLQQLAVIGREFPVSLLRQVIAQPEDELFRLLASLQRKEFLYEQPAFPESEYIFKHALTQEVAYGTVLQERRKALHERTGQAIEQLFHDQLEEHSSELARHYSRSSNTEKAIEYLHLAGQQANRRSAYAEAIAPLTTALEQLNTLPHTTERLQQELELQITLGAALTSTIGWGAPRVEKTYARARMLCQQLGEVPQVFSALNGLRLVHHTKAEFHVAQQLAEQLLNLAAKLHDQVYFVLAHQALAAALWGLGEFTRAKAHCEQGLTFYEPQQHSSHTLLYGDDAGLLCSCFLSSVLWFLGYPDQAQQRLSASHLLAQELSDSLSLATSRVFAAFQYQYRREWRSTAEQVEAMSFLVAEKGFLPWIAVASILQGWVLAQQGQAEEGIEHIRQGIASLQDMGGAGNRPYHLLLLAEACEKGQQTNAALSVLNEALTLVDKTGERLHEAELYRLKGELTLQQWKVESQKSKVPNTQHLTSSTQGEAEACFLKAIEIARQQQAKSWELRAVMSLARLWRQQGKTVEARELLAPVYHWFTEGFDTKDLQEAKALLDSLASGV